MMYMTSGSALFVDRICALSHNDTLHEPSPGPVETGAMRFRYSYSD